MIKKYYQNVFKICELATFSKRRLLFIFVLITILSLLAALFDAIGITMFIPVLFSAVAGEQNLFELVPFLSRFFDLQAISLTHILLIIAGLFALKLVLTIAVILLNDSMMRELRGKMQSNFTANVLNRPLLEIERLRVGEISNRVVLDSARTSGYIGGGLMLGSKAFQAAGYLVSLLFISPMVFLGISAFGGLLYFVLSFFYRYISVIGQKVNKVRDENNRHLVERLHQIRLVKTLGAEKEEVIDLNRRYAYWSKLVYYRSIVTALSQQVTMSVFFFGALLLAIISLFDFSIVTSFIFILAPIYLIFQRFLVVVNDFNRFFVNIKTAEPSVDLVFRDYDMKYHQNQTDSQKRIKKIEKIRLADVFFSYNSTPVLKGIDLELSIGKSVMVRGDSGSGKTTLANLLRCIIKPTSGQMVFNDCSPGELDANALRDHIGYVTQESFIFHGTLRDNLLYGNRRDLKDEQIYEVLEFCGIKDYVRSLPDRLDYEVTERGSVLSGGQKQRLNLARTLLRNPSFIILDEITNNLDKASKKTIRDTTQKLIDEKICFIISHDPEFDFDQIEKYEIKGGVLTNI